MLVLSRKKNESINLGSDIVLTVLSIEGNRVKIGIDAPIDVRIVRSELLPAGQDFPPVRGALLEDCAEPAESAVAIPTLPR